MFLLSRKFWSTHKKQAGAIICSYMLCAVAVVSSCLYFRGLKMTESLNRFGYSGYCDMIFYDLTQEQMDYLENDERFLRFGVMKRVGYAQGEIGDSFVVGSIQDKQSLDMLYLPPEEGRYPEAKGELIIDPNFLSYMGIQPEIGVEVTLQFQDFEGQELGEKTFTITGFIETEEIYSDGFNLQKSQHRQHPDFFKGDYDYSSPMAYLYWEDYQEIFEGAATPKKYHTATYADLDYNKLGEQDDHDVYLELSMEDIVLKDVCMVGDIRSEQAGYILGYYHDMKYANIYGFNEISEGVTKDTNQPDFYSEVLVPCYMCVLFLLTMVSTICLFNVMLTHRRDHIKCYHSLGMTRKSIFMMLMVELAVLAVIGLIAGIIGGVLLYQGIYLLLNHLGAGLYNAFAYFELEVYVNAVTFDPFFAAVVIVLAVYLFSIPILRKEMKKKSVQAPEQEQKEVKGLFSLLYKRERQWYGYQSMASTIIVCVLSVTLILGYLVYCTDTTTKNIDNINILRITEFSYTASKSYAGYNLFENLHAEGISAQCLESVVQSGMVEDYYAKMLNVSTKLSFADTLDNQAIVEAFEKQETKLTAKVRYNFMEEPDEYTTLLAERQDASLQDMGYAENEVLFAAPTVGLPIEKIEELEAYVIFGSINIEALKKGEEILFVVPEGKGVPVQVGDTLPLTDVLLCEEAENSKMLNASSEVQEWMELIRVDELNGEAWPLYSIGGTRVDIPVIVGAVVELPEDRLEKYYCSEVGNYMARYNLTTVAEAFAVWGLPDTMYTEIGIKPIEDFEQDTFEPLWYQMLGESQNVSGVTQSAMYESMEQISMEQMRLYLALGVILAVIGGIGFMNAVSLRTKQLSPTLKKIRCIGADRNLLYKYALWVNMRVVPLVLGVSLVSVGFYYLVAFTYYKLDDIFDWSYVTWGVHLAWLVNGGDKLIGSTKPYPILVLLLICIFVGIVIWLTVRSVFRKEFKDIIKQTEGGKADD